MQDELDSVFLVSEEEKERNHKTAKKLNQLPPIPEKKPMKKKPASTGKPGTAAPRPKTASTAGATGVKKPTRPKTEGAENRPASKNGTGVKKAPPRKVISFEDLEES